MQDAYPATYYSMGTIKIPDAPQDLYVRGRIVNADGALYLTNMGGSINVTGELRAGTLKGLCHGGADDTRADHAHQQALQTGEIVGDHARAKRDIVAGFDLAVAPRETS